jgi:hypothetical protein
MPRTKSLKERLLSRHYPTFHGAVAECLRSGETGDSALAEALLSVTKDRRVVIAAALGDIRGDAGTEALRNAIDGPGASRDLRCAGLLALAKRVGASASADFARHLASSDFVVKSYAMICLAGAGDDRAWDQALKRLNQIVDQPRRNANDPSDVAITIGYLARHTLAIGSSRSIALVRWVREHWERLTDTERRWLARHWPGCVPNGPEVASVVPPDAEAIRQAVRGPLFDAPAFDLDGPSTAGSPDDDDDDW